MKRFPLILMHIFVMISFFLVGIRLIGLEPYFFRWFYAQNNTAANLGLSYSDLMIATQQLLNYMLDRTDSIQSMVMINNTLTPMFNQREIDHMIDVLYLIRAMRIVIVFSLSITAITLWSSRKRVELLHTLFSTYKLALGAVVGFIGAMGAFAIIDFEAFWIVFHQVLFTNDLWLLDPRTDRLINMVPLDFFMILVFLILTVGIILNVGYGVLVHRMTRREVKS